MLQPGGIFIGIDAHPEALKSRFVHLGDTILPIRAESLTAELHAAGFTGTDILSGGRKFKFLARTPSLIGCGDDPSVLRGQVE